MCVLGSCVYVPKGPERYLFDDLLEGYEAGTRPVLNASTPMVVNLSISLHQIMDLVCARRLGFMDIGSLGRMKCGCILII